MEGVEELDVVLVLKDKVPEVPVLHLGEGPGAHEGVIAGIIRGPRVTPMKVIVPVGVSPHADPCANLSIIWSYAYDS